MTQTTAMAVIDTRTTPLASARFGQDRVSLLAEQIGRGWKQPPTVEELEAIAVICERTRLDPLAKPPQIYFIKRWDKKLSKDVMTPQVSIDGMRLAAHRSGQYTGQVGPQWCGTDGQWRDIWLEDKPPSAARVGVLRRGSREPTWAVAMWSEWAGDSPFWKDKPAHMLAKVAEAQALKKAIPAETNDLELTHLDEIKKLEAPGNAATYGRIWGNDENTYPGELPAATYTPTREREVEDAPRDDRVLPPASEQAPAVDPARKRRGDLLAFYGELLSRARTSGVIDNAAPWLLRSDAPEEQIIAKGRELRALMKAAEAPAPPPEPTLVQANSPLGVKVNDLMREAEVGLELDVTDYKITWPALEEEVLRKIERLEELIEAESVVPAEEEAAEPSLTF